MRPRSKPPPSASSRGVRNGSRSLRSLRRLRRSRTMSAKQAGMQARRHARALRAMAQHHLSQSRMRASARRLPKALESPSQFRTCLRRSRPRRWS
ncbi:unnamed protein product [Effrenium voratum]|nr:unnamed protein product [Effrenium voratum]